MSRNYSPGIPTSFDPALYLDSEAPPSSQLHSAQATPLPPPQAPSTHYSDELEALAQCVAEDRAQKTSRGVVIQYRSGRTADAFRSEGDYSVDTPTVSRKRTGAAAAVKRRVESGESATTSTREFPSSPPIMPMLSSPVTYPPSSSAPHDAVSTPKKRKRVEEQRSPLRDVPNRSPPQKIGAFLDDSEDEDEDVATLKDHTAKRRAVGKLPNGVSHYTPPASQEEVKDYGSVPVGDLDDYFESPPKSPAKEPMTAIEDPTSAELKHGIIAKNSDGKPFYIRKKASRPPVSYEQLIASRSTAVQQGHAQSNYYGINIHQLMDDAKARDEQRGVERAQHAANDTPQQSVEQPMIANPGKSSRTLMWTEKYRAKKFTDLVGDERTHRSVLRWLKGWDPIVFPGSAKMKPKSAKKGHDDEEQRQRKVLLLTGPPGLGKTTLAHVCARQAGYEVQEINASDERSRDVVKGRIRDMVGTENVRGVNTNTAGGKVRKAGRPVCVVVDEVDGVVSGSSGGGGGEGGFIKALIDLIQLDDRNSKAVGQQPTSTPGSKKRKGDKFRMLRPLILICNDVYHPSLRPLRQSSFAEVIHIRKPALNTVVSRIQDIFVKEGIQCDSDGARRLCEAIWGVSTKKEGRTGDGTGEGDIRGVMVVGEWVASRLRASAAVQTKKQPHLTRRWIEDNVVGDLNHGGGAARSLGRGGAKDVVDRVFREGAGFPKQAETTNPQTAMMRAKTGVIGVAEAAKRRALQRLREMVDTSGDCDRIVTDCFTAYPEKPFQDDTLLSKPTSAYEWLHFHDTLSSAVHGSQEWELAPYLSQSVLAFHSLFASPRQQSSNPTADPDAQTSVFSGPGANFVAAEQLKANRSQLMSLQSTLSLPLVRMFRSPEELATELIPYTLRMLSPDVRPVIVNTGPAGSKSVATASVRKASEKCLVKKAVEAMAATGVRFERSRVEIDDPANRSGGFVFRMEPPLDSIATFETMSGKKEEKVRYAVRSVLEFEWKKESTRLEIEARKRRGGQMDEDIQEENAKEEIDAEKADEENKKAVKRDFFGRVIRTQPGAETERQKVKAKQAENTSDEGRIWVSFHEGFSNAVRKPITIDELMRGL